MKVMRRASLLAMGMAMLLTQVPVTASAQNVLNEKSICVSKEMESDSIYMMKGDKMILQVRDMEGRVLPVDSWTSSNEKVLKVKKVGKTKGKLYAKENGVVKVKAHIGEAVFTYKIRVNTAIEFPNNSYTVKEGLERHVKLISEIQPDEVDKFSVSVENPEIAEVSLDWNMYVGLRLNITGLSAGTTTFTVYGPTEKDEISIPVKVVKKKKSVKVEEYEDATYRLLSIGQTAFEDEMWNLYNYQQSAAGIKDIFKKSGYTTAVYKEDVSKKGMKKAIEDTFKDAKENDVSVFFYSGSSRVGGLSTVERSGREDMMEFEELATVLKKVPGKVVVILDFGFSGSVADNCEKVLNAKVVNAFADANSKAKAQFGKDKFSVLAACKADEYSITTEYGSLFTQMLAEGLGYFLTSGNTHSAYADINDDNKLTMYEAWKYTKENLVSYETPVCYPAKSGIKLIQK